MGRLGQALHGLGLVQGPLELALERPERALHGLALELLGQAVLELGQVLGLQVPGLVQVVHVQALLPLILGYNLVQLPVFPEPVVEQRELELQLLLIPQREQERPGPLQVSLLLFDNLDHLVVVGPVPPPEVGEGEEVVVVPQQVVVVLLAVVGPPVVEERVEGLLDMIPARVGEHKAMAQVGPPGAVVVVGQSSCLRLRIPDTLLLRHLVHRLLLRHCNRHLILLFSSSLLSISLHLSSS